MLKKTIFAATLALLSSTVFADVEQLKTTIAKQYPTLGIENLKSSELPGFYSGTVQDNVVFISENGEYLLAGNVIRLKDKKNLTQALDSEYNRVDWKQLPFNDALKKVKGKGERQIAVFSDPNCPYCKKLEAELDKLDNVTIYTFVVAFKPQSVAPSRQVYCEKNPQLAWENLISKGIQPTTTKACENPVDRNLALAKNIGIKGTPTLIFADGQKIVGGPSADQIEEIFADMKK